MQQLERIYLDTYILQSDSRLRLPKSAIENLGAVPGHAQLRVYLDPNDRSLIMKVSDSVKEPSHE